MNQDEDNIATTRLPNITHILEWPGTGGVERVVLDLCRTKGEGRQQVIFIHGGPYLHRFTLHGFPTLILDRLPSGLLGLGQLNMFMEDVDILHIHDMDYHPELIRFVEALDLPSILTIHGRSRFPQFPFPTVCVSHEIALMQPSPATCIVIPNGVDVSEFTPRLARRHNDKIVLIRVCRPSRCVPYFWPAMNQLLSDNPNTVLWIVGEDGESSDQITFFGIRDDVSWLLRQADIFVYAPFPRHGAHDLCILEAMASGLCVVATDVSGVKESVAHMKDGILVPFGEIGDFQRAVSTVLHNPHFRSLLGMRARRSVLRNFTLHDVTVKYRRAYDLAIVASTSRSMTSRQAPVDLDEALSALLHANLHS